MNRIGMNTAASDIVIETMVKPTSFEPVSAASSGGLPCSMWRTMFSSMTMASSTTKPIERISAIIDRLSKVKLSTCITAKVPRIENGSASAGISVAEPLWRKAKITATTSSSVISIVHWMSLNASRMFFERSPRMVRWTDGGSACWNDGSRARTASVTSMVLLPGWRITCRLMARRAPALV